MKRKASLKWAFLLFRLLTSLLTLLYTLNRVFPTAIDGKEMGAVELVETLNKLGGENGIGLADLVENRLVGMKSRGVYETPGGAILYHAHEVLETITIDKGNCKNEAVYRH